MESEKPQNKRLRVKNEVKWIEHVPRIRIQYIFPHLFTNFQPPNSYEHGLKIAQPKWVKPVVEIRGCVKINVN